jgi:hypothetical protein
VDDDGDEMERLERRSVTLGWSAFAFAAVVIVVAMVLGMLVVAWYAGKMG